MKPVYITTTHLHSNIGYGGREETLLARAKMLGEQGFKVTILTVDNRPSCSTLDWHLRLNRMAGRNVKLMNIYDYYKVRNKTIYQEDEKQVVMPQARGEIRLVDDEDDSQLIFARPADLVTYWLEEVLSDGDVVIGDARDFDYSFLDLETKVKKIYQLHSSHYNVIDGKLKFRPSFNRVLRSQHKKNDCVIVLTRQQERDILKEFPHLEKNLAYLPHPISIKKIKHRVDDKQICMATRLAPEKNLVDALKAFSVFREENPGFRLVICGEGRSRKELEEKIVEMDLCDDVTLVGFVKNIDRVFQESKFSLISSHFEGFPMAVIGSIANGCPVVSYDIRYGPNEIITEESGMLTSSNSPCELAKAMSAEAAKVRDRYTVQKSVEKYSAEMSKEKWLKLIGD